MPRRRLGELRSDARGRVPSEGVNRHPNFGGDFGGTDITIEILYDTLVL
jgi:hypothetical protein